jgi:SAM-dependent methyltransferase
MIEEKQHIIDRYERRKSNSEVSKHDKEFYFNHFVQSERELKYTEILKDNFNSLEELSFLEIGAGTGTNLFFFKKAGLLWDNIYANELLIDRVNILKKNFSNIHIFSGDANDIDESYHQRFDIILQSTVFTSILDSSFKKKLANKLWQLLKPGGIILWYDFAYDNPNNKDVKGIKISEIKSLFKDSKCIDYKKVTLAPPIGRKVKKWYPFFNIFSFLRTHVIAIIKK